MPALLTPFQVRRLTLRNRIVMAPMANQFATPDGAVTDRHIEHYGARARGVGLVMVEHAYISRDGCIRPPQLGVYDDALIPGLRRLTDAVHAQGAAIGLQINHGGVKSPASVTGVPPHGPSAIPAPPPVTSSITPLPQTELPRPFTPSEISDLVTAFADAAKRAVAAGFDVVEVHGAHGYLLCQFMSPLMNHRDDEFGGDEQRRLTFSCLALRAVRAELGDDFPIFYRFGADDLLEGGFTPEMAERAASALHVAGADVLDVTGGMGGIGAPVNGEEGYFVPLASRVRLANRAAVVGVGNIHSAAYANHIVENDLVDLVAVGRALLKDPEWAAKVNEELVG